MRSMIVFRMDKSYVDRNGKKPLDIILDVIKEFVPSDIVRIEHEGTIHFLAPEWDLEVLESCPINDPDKTAITVTFTKIPAGSLLMHRLMLMNKESKPDVITEYKEKYPTQEN